jgi:mycofactocin precursor
MVNGHARRLGANVMTVGKDDHSPQAQAGPRYELVDGYVDLVSGLWLCAPTTQAKALSSLWSPYAHREDPSMNPESSSKAEQTDESLTAEALIEEVSIDGMCGVY